MKRLTGFLAASVVIVAAAAVGAGCATTSAMPPGTAFTGEVWTWDEQTNTVTLRQGMRDTRVIIGPDQIAKLRLHETKTVYGQLAPPAELPVVLVEGPSTVVARSRHADSDFGRIRRQQWKPCPAYRDPRSATSFWRKPHGQLFESGSAGW